MRLSAAVLAIAASGGGDSSPRSEPLPPRAELSGAMDELGLSARSQGDRNTCSLFAITALASFESGRRGPSPAPRLSEEFLTWAANEATGLTGDQAMFYEAVHGLNALGICTEKRMPYSMRAGSGSHPSPAALAEAKDLSRRWKVLWIKRWDIKTALSDVQLLEIKRALANGHLVAGGLRWPKRLQGWRILEIPPPGDVYDGHSIVFTGYRDDAERANEGELTFRNSAGPKWGKNGGGILSYGYARAYLNDALWLELEPPRSAEATVRFEAEALPVLARGRCEPSTQSMKAWGALLWSGGTQLFCRAETGGYVELGLEAPKDGRYRVRLLGTAAPDFGTVEAVLDGNRVGPQIDLYSGRVSPSGAIELGTHSLKRGSHRLRVTSVARNDASNGFSFGLDAVEWIAAK